MTRQSPLLSSLAAGEIDPKLKGRIDLDWYPHSCELMRNFVAMTEGGATRRPPSFFVGEVPDSTRKTVIRPFKFSQVQAYAIAFGHQIAMICANKGIVVNGNTPVTVATPYTENDVALLRFVQSADTLYIFLPSQPTQQLQRLSHTNWNLVPLPFLDGPYFEVNTTATTLSASAAAGNITINASSAVGINGGQGFLAGDVGRQVRIGYVPPDWATATVYGLGSVVKHNASGVYICRQSGTSAGGPTGTDLGIGDGTCVWDYVNAGGIYYGNATITSLNAGAPCLSVNASVGVVLASSGASVFWRLGLYSLTTGYPRCGDIWQQRMFMAGAAGNPDRIDGSVVADYGNFTPGDTDQDPIADTLGLATVDAILWLSHKRTLFVGTQGSVEKMFGPTGYDSAVTPTGSDTVEQNQRGTADLAPIRIGNGLVYMHGLGRKLLELYYDFTQDIDTATELTARARHMTQGGIADMGYQQEPYSIIWLARNDGALVGCTYYREQQVVAWHAHALGGGGFVESVCTIPGAVDGKTAAADQVWLIVRRTINGVSRRYIEVLDDFNAVEPAALDSDLFFGDCYSLKPSTGQQITTLSGLGYLEGLPVYALADGAVQGPYVVTNGTIKLDQHTADKVYVGLDYSAISYLRPMPLETGAQGGTPKGQVKRIDKLVIGLYRSGSFFVGDDDAHMDLEPERLPTDRMDTAVPLHSMAYECPFDGDYALEVSATFKPLAVQPLTILWIVPRVMTNEG